MDVEKIVFNQKKLLEHAGELSGYISKRSVHNIRFNIAPSTKRDAAALAFGDGVIGVVVGEFKDGSPAFLTDEFSCAAVGIH